MWGVYGDRARRAATARGGRGGPACAARPGRRAGAARAERGVRARGDPIRCESRREIIYYRIISLNVIYDA